MTGRKLGSSSKFPIHPDLSFFCVLLGYRSWDHSACSWSRAPFPTWRKWELWGGVPTGEGFKPWPRTRTSLVTGVHSKQGDSVNGRSRDLRGGRFQVFQKVQAGSHRGSFLGSNTWALTWWLNNINLACAHTWSAVDLVSCVMFLYLSSSPGNCHRSAVTRR